jgi:predicted adenylyl cyclase CyaB
MPRNLELKASLPSAKDGHAYARAIGAESGGVMKQVDTYFTIAQGRLKLRELEDGPAELIFYRRDESNPERWSDYQKESVGDGKGIKRILTDALGIRVEVRKERYLYIYHGARVHIDEVEGLGTFLEFEVPIGGAEDPEKLTASLRASFHVQVADIIKASYSDLICAKKLVGET